MQTLTYLLRLESHSLIVHMQYDYLMNERRCIWSLDALILIVDVLCCPEENRRRRQEVCALVEKHKTLFRRVPQSISLAVVK